MSGSDPASCGPAFSTQSRCCCLSSGQGEASPGNTSTMPGRRRKERKVNNDGMFFGLKTCERRGECETRPKLYKDWDECGGRGVLWAKFANSHYQPSSASDTTAPVERTAARPLAHRVESRAGRRLVEDEERETLRSFVNTRDVDCSPHDVSVRYVCLFAFTHLASTIRDPQQQDQPQMEPLAQPAEDGGPERFTCEFHGDFQDIGILLDVDDEGRLVVQEVRSEACGGRLCLDTAAHSSLR